MHRMGELNLLLINQGQSLPLCAKMQAVFGYIRSILPNEKQKHAKVLIDIVSVGNCFCGNDISFMDIICILYTLTYICVWVDRIGTQLDIGISLGKPLRNNRNKHL